MASEKEKHEHHHWLIVLLAITIIALLGLVTFFAYQVFYGDTVRTIKRVEFDSDSITDGINEQHDLLQEFLLEEQEEILEERINSISILAINGTSNSPGFSYPETWHVFSSTTLDTRPGYVKTIFVDESPIQLIEGESIQTITMHSIERSDADLGGEAFYLNYFDAINDNEFYEESSRKTTRVHGNFLTHIKAHESGLLDIDVEYLIYETAIYSFVVKFIDDPTTTEDNLVWDSMIPSFDFSTME